MTSIRLVLDSNILVYALHIPTDKRLLKNHNKSVKIFESITTNKNDLFLPSDVVIETINVLSKFLKENKSKESYEKLDLAAKEIYPFSENLLLNTLFIVSSHIFFLLCIENSRKFSKIKKDKKDEWIPGWKESKTEVKISGMDVVVLSYTQIKNGILITNDWSLWYVAWKSGLKAYWLSGLDEKDIDDICKGKEIVYPKK